MQTILKWLIFLVITYQLLMLEKFIMLLWLTLWLHLVEMYLITLVFIFTL